MTLRSVENRFALAVAAVVAVAGVHVLRAQDAQDTLRERLLSTKACAGCELAGADFSGKDLRGADLHNAALAKARFYRANLSKANLNGADLSGAVLTFADLSEAVIGTADLSGANLVGAIGADLSQATTTAATVCPGGQAGPCR